MHLLLMTNTGTVRGKVYQPAVCQKSIAVVYLDTSSADALCTYGQNLALKTTYVHTYQTVAQVVLAAAC